jgi:hypothetical protein
MKMLKKKNLKIDDDVFDDDKKKQGNQSNKNDRLFNLADSQSVELYVI